VTICDRWRGEHGFKNFLTDMGKRPKGTTLGRFRDTGDYRQGNCAWQTSTEQGAEKRKKNMSTLSASVTAIDYCKT